MMILIEVVAVSVIALSLFFTIDAKVTIVPGEKIEDCTNQTDRASIFDFSGITLVPINDTHTFINGTWKFNEDLTSPWVASCVGEKYVRGEWLMQGINRQYKDLCKSWHSPMEPFYGVTQKLPGCPVKAGTIWNFNMHPIVFSPMLLNSIPAHYVGSWRGVFGGEFKGKDGKIVKECKRVYFDIFED